MAGASKSHNLAPTLVFRLFNMALNNACVKIRSDRKFELKSLPPITMVAISRRGELTRQKKKQPWCVHQSLAWTLRGRCCWARCPGIEKVRRKLNTNMTTLCAARNAAQWQDATFICAMVIRVAKW